MKADSIKFKGHLCFRNTWAGFDSFKAINLIIGRNNTGKSRLLDLLETSAAGTIAKGVKVRQEGVLDEESLKGAFSPTTSGGTLGGNFWHSHGRLFVGKRISWESDGRDEAVIDSAEWLTVGEGMVINADVIAARKYQLSRLCLNASSPLKGRKCFRLFAERDMTPENEAQALSLAGTGRGASNVVRRHLISSNSHISRALINVEVLGALNRIFLGDAIFTEIGVYQHDEPETATAIAGTWEVFLSEKSKERISLGSSGSGIKTVILVLLNLLVMPKVQNLTGKQCVFIFEELENNLHPSVFRRLLAFIEEWIIKEDSIVFLTTHSSVALDVFGLSDTAQILHLSHDGDSAKTTTVAGFFERRSILSDLGAKPSDLLQANGIVWVEGPSDRIYLNRWIDLASEGQLREGRDYQCAYYGGSMLADDEFVIPENESGDLTNLLRINSNIAVVCDGDRTSPTGAGAELKKRVDRVRDEVAANPSGRIWITDAKEIENYLPIEALQKVLPGIDAEPQQYEHFFPSQSAGAGESFWERQFKRKSYDKVDLAWRTVPHLTKAQMEARFDWKVQMAAIVDAIKRWNA